MHKFDGAENLTVFVRYDYNEQARSFANSRKKFRIQFARSCADRIVRTKVVQKGLK